MRTLTRFYLKCLLLALPFLLLLGAYAYSDPFMVLRHYNNVEYDHSRNCLDEAMVSWEKYKNNRSHAHYDAFIMGSSCTKAFLTDHWNRYIHAHPYRMFCNSETLDGVRQKLVALDRQPQQPIRHLLIIVDADMLLKNKQKDNAMLAMPPEVSGKRWSSYQSIFLQAFFTPKFLVPWVHYQLTGRYRESMRGVINRYLPERTSLTNDAVLPNDSLIAREGERYWQTPQWQKDLAKRPAATVLPPQIHAATLDCLHDILRICLRHHTDVRIVLGPDFRRRRVNPADVEVLRRLFGSRQVADYSVSTRFTDYHCFYDAAHYRRCVGDSIMAEIY